MSKFSTSQSLKPFFTDNREHEESKIIIVFSYISKGKQKITSKKVLETHYCTVHTITKENTFLMALLTIIHPLKFDNS